MRTMHLLCVRPECSGKPLHLLNIHCVQCGKRIKSGIVYGPFIILACNSCFIKNILPRLPDEALLYRKWDFIPLTAREEGRHR